MDKDESAVEGLKKKLYSRTQKFGGDVRAPLTHEETKAPVGWEDMPVRRTEPPAPAEKRHMSFAAKFLVVSGGFFVVALGAAAVAFLWGPNTISPSNIDIQIIAPSLVDGGQPTDLHVLINNKNPAALELADLVIDYPAGTRDPSNPSQTLTEARQSLGTVPAASQVKRTASAIFYGQEGAAETLHVTVEYSVAGSNAVFTKSSDTTITIGSSPVSISVNTPAEVIAGQAFPIDLTVRSNSTAPINNVVVQAQTPFGYTLQGSSPQASAGTLWRLGTLNPGDTRDIRLTGAIDGQDGDTRVFKFLSGVDADPTDTGISVPFLVMPATVTVSKPFITGSIAVNGQSSSQISVSPGSTIAGVISWQNNLPTAVNNIQVTLVLQGPMIDQNSISPGSGFYQSSTNSIVWTSQQDPTLAQAAAGATGQLNFSFGTLPPGTGGAVYTNTTATLSLSVAAVRPGAGDVPQTITSAATTQVSFASQLSLAAQSLHYSGPYSDPGPIPPVADAATAYTIAWQVKNSSNTVGNAAVSAVLPPYVTFVTGQPGVSYDPGSRTVTWSIGDLKAGVGYTLPALQTAFQVTLTPSTSQVGTGPALTGTAALTGTDRFANVAVQASAPAPTTRTGDPNFAGGMDIVAPKQ